MCGAEVAVSHPRRERLKQLEWGENEGRGLRTRQRGGVLLAVVKLPLKKSGGGTSKYLGERGRESPGFLGRWARLPGRLRICKEKKSGLAR